MYTAFEKRNQAKEVPAGTVPPPIEPPGPRPVDWSAGRAALRSPWLWIPLLALAAILGWLVWALPVGQALAPLPEPSLVLLDRNGVAFARRGALKEEPVDSRTLPPHVVGAVLSIEDRRFFQHWGIDPTGVARAAFRNVRAGGIEQGASTITQQLAKTSFLTPERTLRRKLREGLIAVWLEARLSKHEILSRYLSSIYFGDGVYGLRGAARHYFDVAPEQLDVAQAAMLAGMIKAPSSLAPTQHPQAARERAQVVLQAMVASGVLEEDEARAVTPARVREGRADLPVGTYFADWMSPQAKDAFDAGFGEVPVNTTLDLRLQEHAERVIAEVLREHGDGAGVGQVALVAMRANGEVIAMVGGRDYKSSPYNRVTQAQRQPGSAFKLFVYRAAIRSGVTPEDSVDDSPLTVGDWTPANYNDSYRGRMTVRDAFAHSSNVAAVRLAQSVGAPAVVNAARELGITTELGADGSLALGSYETTLLELTAAYASLAAGAYPVVPYGVSDHPYSGPQQPMETSERAMLLDLLWNVVEQGTGRAAQLRMPAFGKTGTTQDYRDALFVGMAGDLVTGVWVGNDDNTSMRNVTGGTLPAQIWREFMAGAALDDNQQLVIARDAYRAPHQVDYAPVSRRDSPRRSGLGNWFRKKFGRGGKDKGRRNRD